MSAPLPRWSGGLAEWIDGDTAYLSIAFTWMLDKAHARAVWYRALGYNERVMRMLRHLAPKKKRVYVLIGNEPFDVCMGRIREVIEWGGEPHVQPLMKLAALTRDPWVKDTLDWEDQGRRRGITGAQLLRNVARWANGWVWKTAPFEDYKLGMGHGSQAVDDRQGSLLQ